MRFCKRYLLAGACFLLCQTDSFNATAQLKPDSLFSGMSYKNIGPNRGGRSLGIAGSASRKMEYYFGAVGGGLWKTTDAGLNWKPVTDGQLGSSSVGAVAVAETNPDIVYIGTGECQFRGNIMQGDGVYKSIDAGKTWNNIGLKNSQVISRIRIHPKNPDIVYAAALGHPYGPNEERGVFKTIDGGKSWKKVLFKSEKAGAVDLVIDPVDPEIIYASIWEVYRTPYKMWGGGGASGLFKSSNGGESWTEITRSPGLPKGAVGKIGVTVSPVDHLRVWAIIESDSGGLYRSDDGGQQWKLVNNERKLRQRAFYYSRIYADPKNKDGIWGLNVDFFKSMDGGVTFDKNIKLPHGDNHDLWIDPTDPTRLAESNDGGGTISNNGGDSWTDEDFPTAQLYHVFVTADFPYHVAAAQQDNSTIALPSEDWSHMKSNTNSMKPGIGFAYGVGGGESGYITQDPKDKDIFFAGSQGALLTRINRKTGQIRDVQVYPRMFSGEEAKTLPERWQWTYPIVFSPVDKNRLYTCSQHVWVSTDNGDSWEKISPDLTYNDTATLGTSGGIITRDMNGPEIYGTVFALAPSYHDVNTIWAGSDDGLIHITRDHGKLWQNITPKDMPKDTRVSIIEASRHKPGTAYIAAKRYQMDDRNPYIWKTDDYGKTWTKITDGLEPGDYIHAVREDITRPGLLFAGSEHGVRVSFNDGAKWEPLQLNLPNTQVSDLIVTEKDLVVGTHGRSIYILKNITPVREYKAGLENELYLYTVHPAVRNVQNASFLFNVPAGIDSITLDIKDANGKLIQQFGSSRKSTEAEKNKPKEAVEDYWAAGQKPLTVKTGLNQFEWVMQYAPPTSFKGIILWGGSTKNGPMAPTGKYQVSLRAGTGTNALDRNFTIILDPRLQNVTDADVQEQFKLASLIRDRTSEANEAVIKIRAVKAKMLKGKMSKTDQTIFDQLTVLEENLYQVKNQSAQDPLNYPIKLNNKIAALQNSIETGDARPTKGAYKVYDELTAELTIELNKLKAILSQKSMKKYS